MIFAELALPGVWLVRPERRTDARGFFARTFCADAFAAAGLPTAWAQCNVSFNARAGTLRGLHWQAEPHPEGKLIRCVAGAIFDVVADVRNGSATRGRWVGVILSAASGEALYIPPGLAHGFQALRDASEIFYQMTERYHAGLASGVRWDSPALGIDWPLPEPLVSDRDAALPVLR